MYRGHLFQHAWVLPREIDEQLWAPFRRHATIVIRAVTARLEANRPSSDPGILRGPLGLGLPQITQDRIAFNGSAFRGQAGAPFILEQRASSGIVMRVGAARTARAVRRCDTLGHPYDLAVCALLVLAKESFGESMRLGSSAGLLDGWRDAASVVRGALSRRGHLVQSEHGLLQWADGTSSPPIDGIRSSA